MRWQIRSLRTDTNVVSCSAATPCSDEQPRQPPHALGETGERVHVARQPDLHRELAEAESLQREHVALGHDADELSASVTRT